MAGAYTVQLSDFVGKLSWKQVPPETAVKCKTHLLDTLGVALAGSGTPHARQATEVIREFYCMPESTVINHDWKTTAAEAAFANAIMAHSIDFDDGHKFVHPGCVVVPVCMALAEKYHVDGRSLILALLAGYETSIRVSLAAGLSHRKRGYHPTGTCNTFGAAASAAKLMGLGTDKINSCLGIACTQAAGITQYRFDGSSIKHLHAALAARNGVLAALLSAKGFRGTNEALEGEFGFLNVTAEGGEPHWLTDQLDTRFFILDTDIKPYPSCRQTHAPVDLILTAVMENDLHGQDVEQIALYTYAYANQTWLISTRPPTSGLQAMLNTPYCLSSALVNRKLTLAEFADDALKNKAVLDLMPKIEVKVDRDLTARFPAARGARLHIRLKDGRSFDYFTDNPRGSREKPITFSEVVCKFNALAEPVIGEEKCKGVVTLVNDLENLADAAAIAELLTPGPTAKT
jgi:2-methylcitrate dehydratase PrpD